MAFNWGWESQKDRLSRFMRMSPKKKLEWLREINEFISNIKDKKLREITLCHRENRSLGKTLK